jgi:hypothetical protein
LDDAMKQLIQEAAASTTISSASRGHKVRKQLSRNDRKYYKLI